MTFEWDAANRLIAVNNPASMTRSEFSYDGFDRRIQIVEKIGSAVSKKRKFVWVGERLAEEQDGNNAIVRRYFPEGEIISTAFTK